MAAEDWIDCYGPPDEYFEPRLVTCRICGVGNLVWEISARTGKYYLATQAGNKHQCKRKNVDREINKFFKEPGDD